MECAYLAVRGQVTAITVHRGVQTTMSRSASQTDRCLYGHLRIASLSVEVPGLKINCKCYEAARPYVFLTYSINNVGSA